MNPFQAQLGKSRIIKTWFCLSFLFLNGLSSFGQRNTVSAGGDAEGANGSVSYSVGQAFYISAEGENGNINPGLQQPFEVGVITGIEHTDIRAVVFPNPTAGQIQLQFDSDSYTHYKAELMDGAGRLISAKDELKPNNNFSFEMAPNGIYTLTVYRDEKLIKSFRIVKNN